MEAKPSLSLYTFNEMWHPGLMVVLLAIAIIYFLIIGSWRHHFEDSQDVRGYKQFCFISGLFLYYIVMGSPWHVIGNYLFSVHMINMTIAYLSVPPLILLGFPEWFWRPVLRMPRLKKFISLATKPVFAVVFFNMAFSFDHLPIIFNFVSQSAFMMFVVHICLLFLAFLMWWPMLSPYKELNALTDLKKIFYMFADGILLTPACALLFLSGDLIYQHYFNVPQLVGFLSPMDDQQSAGVFMKVIQEITYGIGLGVSVYCWVNYGHKKEKDDAYGTSELSKTLRPFDTTNQSQSH